MKVTFSTNVPGFAEHLERAGYQETTKMAVKKRTLGRRADAWRRFLTKRAPAAKPCTITRAACWLTNEEGYRGRRFRLAEIAAMTDAELLRIPNFGKQCIRMLQEAGLRDGVTQYTGFGPADAAIERLLVSGA